MRRLSLSALALLLVITGVAGTASAGNTIPLLTGTFASGGSSMNMTACFAGAPYMPLSVGPNNNYSPIVPATQSGGSYGLSDGSGLSLLFSGNYASLSEFNQGWFDGLEEWCQSSYYGNMNGIITGVVDFVSGGSLTFTGGVWGGASNGDSKMSNGCPTSCNVFGEDSSMQFTFRGVWSNEWWSTGSFAAGENTQGIFLFGFSSVEMTTYTPEPTTMVLVVSGLAPVISSLRRKLRRR